MAFNRWLFDNGVFFTVDIDSLRLRISLWIPKVGWWQLRVK
jgi:hypothetical protein